MLNIIYIIYINIINNEYRVYETRIVRRKGNTSECGARAPVSFTRSQALSTWECDSTGTRTWRRACAKVRKDERAREGENERINEWFLRMERPWDRRRCAGAPSSEWADRVNVNASWASRRSECEDESEILEWRASGNLRSCDRYKRNIFLFPGNIIWNA